MTLSSDRTLFTFRMRLRMRSRYRYRSYHDIINIDIDNWYGAVIPGYRYPKCSANKGIAAERAELFDAFYCYCRSHW